MESEGAVTRLVRRWSAGDEDALKELVSIVYDDLRVIAHRQLRRTEDGATLHTTALVNEVYLRLAGVNGGMWKSRGHFFAFCSKAMRHVLIDYARKAKASKRGGDDPHVPLDDDVAGLESEIARIIEVDEALQRLAAHDARMARTVECKFFGGLTNQETAEALDVSTRTVERDWTRARIYLKRLLDPVGPE